MLSWTNKIIVVISLVMKDNNAILQTLGNNLRQIRKSKDMTQLDLEIASGITAGDISKIETGQINVAFTTLIKLAVSLQVELSELYNLNEH
jgi:transcriptional regulator with XRE-family HTH domain